MKVVIAPDSFKGSATALEVAEALAIGFRQVFSEARIELVPMADGGEGTVEALVSATGGQTRSASVQNPLGDEITAEYGILGDGVTAVIEMSAASGLTLVTEELRNPMVATTYGTGQLIQSALDHGCRRLLIGLGGSATNDGGAGAAIALGANLKTADGKPIETGGQGLADLAEIDITEMDPRINETEVVVACDVDNPLTGPHGAAHVYGPQKGATPEMIQILDQNLEHYASVIERDVGKVVTEIPGVGAAGGLGAGLIAFINAKLKSGVDMVTETVELVKRIKEVDLVITGEGKLDAQTIYGKTPIGVAKIARQFGVPVIAIAGGIEGNPAELYQAGITAMVDIIPHPMQLDQAMQEAVPLISQAGERIARLISIGIGLS
ncbi:MAG: glycerate kinase [Candidatus Poribacteria bacterium]|nr:glycerate kinase [Candidatus Poribacteria bacterium]